MYLNFMSFSRATQNGRRITATARVREQPEMNTLVALVLYLADRLHADEQVQQRTNMAREDQRSSRDDLAEEGTYDDTLTASASHR